MNVRIEMTARLAEIAGFATRTREVKAEATLHETLRTFERELQEGSGARLVPNGRLHPSILVVVDGCACATLDRSRTLSGGETIELLLPVAGG